MEYTATAFADPLTRVFDFLLYRPGGAARRPTRHPGKSRFFVRRIPLREPERAFNRRRVALPGPSGRVLARPPRGRAAVVQSGRPESLSRVRPGSRLLPPAPGWRDGTRSSCPCCRPLVIALGRAAARRHAGARLKARLVGRRGPGAPWQAVPRPPEALRQDAGWVSETNVVGLPARRPLRAGRARCWWPRWAAAGADRRAPPLAVRRHPPADCRLFLLGTFFLAAGRASTAGSGVRRYGDRAARSRWPASPSRRSCSPCSRWRCAPAPPTSVGNRRARDDRAACSPSNPAQPAGTSRHFFIVMLAGDPGGLPVDNPATHLRAHHDPRRRWFLEYSGRHLALVELGVGRLKALRVSSRCSPTSSFRGGVPADRHAARALLARACWPLAGKAPRPFSPFAPGRARRRPSPSCASFRVPELLARLVSRSAVLFRERGSSCLR